ncbi:iron complex outermembrane receptor protein [Runella defluvii]|uniref:Iron complex outermembrane receptor protein n=1 Tax=Runella defluvii TaxID=370973 RepID=A0A7W6ETC4_9BACT|nr:TonB-dependent receptor [Runella defluvii]MBB3841442.1 iron complex outermembrane receptor protein [Runella defluvii]
MYPIKVTIQVLLFCILGSYAIAQTLKGTVKSTTGENVAFATITLLNSPKGTVADKNGSYQLTLTRRKYEVSVSAVGYATQIQQVTMTDKNTELNFSLNPSTQDLGEVVVTADKTEQNLLTIPIAVSSLSAKKVEDARIWELANLTAIVPNYLYSELGVAFQQIQSIRGVQVFSENPAVATYIDDVNALDIIGGGFQMADIERVEVLRGPQGTLFGRNAMGGVVNIITKKPTNRTNGFAELSLGNLGLQRYNAGFKTPIVKDKLFFGINGVYSKRNGFLKNDTTGLGKTDKNIQGARVGDEESLYGNAYLRWFPSSKFSATLNVKAQMDKSDATGFMLSVGNEKLAFANPDKIYLTRIGTHQRNIVNTSLNLKYYGSGYTLTSVSATQAIGMAYKDVDFPGYYHTFREKEIGEMLPPQKVFTQEFRINSNAVDSKLSYSAGVFYFNQTGYEPTTNLAYELAPGMYAAFRNKTVNNGLAVFGQIGYKITPSLELTAGLRYDNENRKAIFNGFGDAVFTNNVLTFVRPDSTVTGKYTAVSPKVAINYIINSKSSIYVSYTRGFRAGGVNSQRLPKGISQTFQPEFSDNFEAGLKATGMENKLRVGLTAFLINWKDLQFYNLVAPFTYARENLGDVQTRGLEFDATMIPVKNLELDASLGLNSGKYQDFKLTRVDFATMAETKIDVTGKKLANAPNHTFYLAAQYGIPLAKTAKLSLRGEYRSVGQFYTDLQNTLKQPTYSLINTRINLQVGKLNAAFWVQNLANTRYLIYGSGDTSFGRSVRMASPRTLGITLNYGF